jgi:hypothetical protein
MEEDVASFKRLGQLGHIGEFGHPPIEFEAGEAREAGKISDDGPHGSFAGEMHLLDKAGADKSTGAKNRPLHFAPPTARNRLAFCSSGVSHGMSMRVRF